MPDEFGKFTRKKLLGAGGMGEVWLAWDGQLGRWVALKFLKGASADDLARFQREAQVAARLNHPHIAAIYEVGEAQGQHFIAMQYVEGATLKPRKDRREIVQLIADAARAVHYAHEEGVVHRDLKPDNLMVTAKGHLFVMDFGLARQAEGRSDLSRSGLMVGTPSYMPPEQARGERVDRRADVYSLGATLYELITAHRPVEGGNVIDTLRRVVEEEPVPPRRHDATIDPDLQIITLRCLEKDRAHRYPTAASLADDLERFLAGEAIQAHAPSMVYRIGKIAKRRRGILIAAAVVLLVVGILVPGWIRESKARRQGDAALAAERSNTEALTELGTLWAQVILAKQGLYKKTEDPQRVMRKIRDAVGNLGAFISRFPDTPQGYYVRAKGHLYLGNLEAAESDARQSIRLNDRFDPGHLMLGRVLLESYMDRLYGDDPNSFAPGQRAAPLLQEARTSLARAASRKTEASWGLTRTAEDDVAEVIVKALVLIYVDRKVDDAKALLAARNAETPSEEYCNWLGRYSRDRASIEWQDRALATMPHFSRAYIDRGNIRKLMGDPAGAIADFTEALRIDPDSWVAHFNRANGLRDTKDIQGAIDDYSRAIELKPRYAASYTNRGILRCRRGDHRGALPDFEEAIRLDPSESNAYNGRAGARLGLGDVEGGLADYTKAMELDPKDGLPAMNRGIARRDRGDLAGALEDFKVALERDPTLSGAYFHRARVRELQNDPDAAMRDYDTAIQVNPRDKNPLQNRGALKFKLGDVQGAADDFTAALAIDPRNAHLLTNRGRMRRLLKDLKGALEDYAAAIRIDPDDADAYLNEGQVRYDIGNLDGALADFEKCVELDPKRANGYGARGRIRQAKGDFRGAAEDYRKALELCKPGEPLYAAVEGWIKSLPK